jgi:hypothetical protein
VTLANIVAHARAEAKRLRSEHQVPYAEGLAVYLEVEANSIEADPDFKLREKVEALAEQLEHEPYDEFGKRAAAQRIRELLEGK